MVLFWVCPEAEISWPFLSTMKTTFALASLVRRSQTALMRCTPRHTSPVACPWACNVPFAAGIGPGFPRDSASVRAAALIRTPGTVAGSKAMPARIAPAGRSGPLARAAPGLVEAADHDPTRRGLHSFHSRRRLPRLRPAPTPALLRVSSLPVEAAPGSPGAGERRARGAGRFRSLARPVHRGALGGADRRRGRREGGPDPHPLLLGEPDPPGERAAGARAARSGRSRWRRRGGSPAMPGRCSSSRTWAAPRTSSSTAWTPRPGSASG